MAFCANCGNDIKEAKFCSSCGAQAGAAAAVQSAESAQPPAQPRTVTVGQVKKCPSCGSPVESFQSRCSACGHEIGVAKVSDAIKEFSTEINALDEKIAKEKGFSDKSAVSGSKSSKNKTASTLRAGATGVLLGSSLTGSSKSKSSSSSKKSAVGGLLIIGVLVGAVALIAKIIKNFKNAIARPVLSPSEKVKKSYIENFVIPNNREDILEFILMASTKAEGVIDLGHGETMGEIASAHFWAKVWENKCKKIEDRALISLQGDSETMSHIKKFYDRTKAVYQSITQAKKKGQVKSVILFILMLITVTLIAAIVIFLLLNLL